MGKVKHRKHRSDCISSVSSEAGSVEELPSKKARRSRKQRHSSSDDETDSAGSTTSGETRSSTSICSSSSSSEPRRKRRRRSHHHKRSHKHRDSKGKRRETKRHRRKGDVRRRHKKGEKDTSGQPEPENRPVAVEWMPVSQQVAQVEKLHTSGPLFPYPPSAGLRSRSKKFIKCLLCMGSVERAELLNHITGDLNIKSPYNRYAEAMIAEIHADCINVHGKLTR